jgi:hypothetical protein
VETLEDNSYPRLDGVLKPTTFCILGGNTHNTTNSHFADAIDFPIFSHRHYLKIAFPLMRGRNASSNGAVATPSTPFGHKSLGQSAGQKYISLTYDGLNCGHCGRNLFKTFALSRRRARWRVSPAHSFSPARTTIYSDPVVSRNKGNLELPFMSDGATTFPCQLPAGDGNSFLANRCHNMTAHVSGKLLLVCERRQHLWAKYARCARSVFFAKLLLSSVDLRVCSEIAFVVSAN